MALGTPAVLSTIGSATDANNYAGSSGTPGNNELLIACVGATQGGSVDPTTPTIANSPWGLTFTRLSSSDNNWGGAGAVRRKGWIFYTVTDSGTSYSADTFDVDFGGVTQTGCCAICLGISGATLTNGGLDGIVQNIIAQDVNTPYLPGTLSAAGASGNRPLAFYAVNAVTDIVHDSGGGWSEISTVSCATPTIQYAAHWNSGSFDTTPSATTSLNQIAGQWALEIAESVAANADVSLTTAAAIAAIPSVTIAANADTTTTTIAAQVDTIVVSQADANLTPTTIAGVGAVSTPSVDSGAGLDASVVFLDVPENVQAIPVDADRIDVSWDAVTGASEYLVERDGVVVATNPDTTYSDTGLEPETTYSYRVKAVA